jgi:hypothetical protein
MLSDLKNTAVDFASKNATVLLTAGGVVGTVATAVLTGRASITAHRLLEMEQSQLETSVAEESPNGVIAPQLSTTQKLRIVSPHFIPPLIVCAATITSIVMANRISAREAAVLAAAYGVSERQLKEYKAKITERVTGKKADEIRVAVQEERVEQHPPNDRIMMVGTGDVVVYDSYSDRYFHSTYEKIKKAESAVVHEILDRNECSLSVFYNELGWASTMVSDQVGWNLENAINVEIDAITHKGEPILTIEFTDNPVWEYNTKY